MTTADQQDMLMQLLHDKSAVLDPALEFYIEQTEMLGPVLKHPLVFQVPMYSPGLANRVYRDKTEMVAKALDQKQWNTYVYLHERPYRLEAFTRIADTLPDETYWDLLGDVWTDSENIWQNLEIWHEMLASERPGREFMMNKAEREALAEMPQVLTVYRGCIGEQNEDGPSWTLDKQRAIWFAKRFEREDLTPIVITATIDKSHVAAYFSGRGEEEVVVPEDAPLSIHTYEEV